MTYLFTSESVSAAHPDKVCDRISDEIVDLYLSRDPQSRVAVETLATANLVILAGEVRGPETITSEVVEAVARRTIRDLGYSQEGFHWNTVEIRSYLHPQSSDIAQGVDRTREKDEGAGDQGIMFGFACNETVPLMPAPLYYAHTILKTLFQGCERQEIPLLGPDAKSQVTLRYVDGVPVEAAAIVVSIQHDPRFEQEELRQMIRPYVVKALPEGWMCSESSFYINPTGRFVIGGPACDTGLTGRKIMVDTYGGAIAHGGGAFSGKDPTKVDRSGAYAARYLAKNIVAAELSDRCSIQLSYVIGQSQPLSFYINLHENGRVDPRKLERLLRDAIDLSPRGIRERLQLNRPIYSRTSAYGHFGREPEVDGGFSWERTDLVSYLKSMF